MGGRVSTGEGTIEQVLAGDATWAVVGGASELVLQDVPSRSVDSVICDPPYNERTHSSAKTSKADGDGHLDIDFDPLSSFEFVPRLVSLARQWCVCFCALEQLGEYADAAGDAWIRAGIWDRRAGTAFARSDRPFQGAEGIAIMSGAKEKVFPAGAKRAVWVSPIERNDREHETQKPLGLMLEIVADFTSPGDLVLDPFCGSSTTGVACLRLGRRYIGIEKQERWVNFSRERLGAESQCNTLSASRAGQESLFKESA
jgi:site-specific DNA-methyltransferase (adenine-specific)